MLRRNVLIFHSGALGDFVLSWPMALAAARLFAQSRIIYVTAGQKGLLAEKVLRVESADVEAGWHGLFAEGGSVAEPQRKMLAGAHTVFSFVAFDNDPWTVNARRIAPEAKVICLRGMPRDAAGQTQRHVIDDLIEQLCDEPVIQESVRQIVRSIRDRGLMSPWRASNSVLIHPGSGGREKCWPVENFVQVIRELKKRGETVRVAIGEVELERWEDSERAKLEAIAPVTACSTYLELFQQILAARVFVGNDSGPGHLAGILGAQTVSIFQRTDPRLWAPVGPRVAALNRPEVEEVVRAAG